ncbi:MAG: NAAT family transporter [Psychromonas sp.]|nr:NAAT family transporter [Psychromonas sp.]
MDFSTYIHTITALFVIIDPIGSALIFNSLSMDASQKKRTKMALKATIISTLTLILFGNYGEALFTEIGININSLRISGGLLLFHTAFQMVTQEKVIDQQNNERDISIFPMTIPLLSGPGTLTLSVLLFSNSNEITDKLSVAAAIISVMLLTLILIRLSTYLKHLIGHTGDELLRRFFGVIVATISIQFIFDGIHHLLLKQ